MFLNLWVRQKKITIHSLFGSPCSSFFLSLFCRKIWFSRRETHISGTLAPPPCLELIVTFISLWCCISISSISSYLSFRPGGAAVSGFHLPFYCLHSLHFHTKVRSSRANMEKEKSIHFNDKEKICFLEHKKRRLKGAPSSHFDCYAMSTVS